MGRRSRRRGQRESAPASTTDYRDAEGNVLRLRDALSAGTLGELERLDSRPAASADDRWQRRVELLELAQRAVAQLVSQPEDVALRVAVVGRRGRG